MNQTRLMFPIHQGLCVCVCVCVCTLYVARRSIQLFRGSGTLSCFRLHSYSRQTPRSQSASTHTHTQTHYRLTSMRQQTESSAVSGSFSPDHVTNAQGCPDGAGPGLSVSKTTPLSCWRPCSQRVNLDRQMWRGGAEST